MSDKRFPLKAALEVTQELCPILETACERLMVVGSVRRGKEDVGDVEILFIPKVRNGGLFGDLRSDQTTSVIDNLVLSEVLKPRRNVKGHLTWGRLNKLALHCKSGIPVDLFSVPDPSCWWNSVVVRTGGKENNLLITTTAIAKGWHFEAYGSGFKHMTTGEHNLCTSEQDVYAFLGLPYLEPLDRK